MKKEILDRTGDSAPPPRGPWIEVDSLAQVRLTSEDPAHPIESALQEGGAPGWKAAQPGPQTIWLRFEAPHNLREVHLRFESAEQRTQEFVLLSSSDDGETYREIVRQQFNFSPGTPVEEETYHPNLAKVTDLKLTITPDISGGQARATLRTLLLR